MKPIRTEYPKVRLYTKSGITYYRVDLRRKGLIGPKTKNFGNRTDALDYARKIGEQVSQLGIKSIAQVDVNYSDWQASCAVYGKTIEQAIELALNHWALEQRQSKTPLMPELCKAWIYDKEHDTLKPLRERSLASIKTTGNKFARDFEGKHVTDFTRESVEDYLNGMESSNQYKKNIKNYLGQFFNWCIRKGHCEKNPCEDIVISVVHDEVEFYKVEQVKTMLRTCMQWGDSERGSLHNRNVKSNG